MLNSCGKDAADSVRHGASIIRMQAGVRYLPIPLVADLLDPDLLATHCTVQSPCMSEHGTTRESTLLSRIWPQGEGKTSHLLFDV